MPMYNFACQKCGHRFDRIQKHNDPSPPCPAPSGLPGTARKTGPPGHWADFWAQAAKDFERGKLTPYPGAPGNVEVGPDQVHTVIPFKDGKPGEPVVRTLAEWLAMSPGPCGGETQRLIGGGTFHLKGGGWASDGYGG